MITDQWQKPNRCTQGACVEVRATPHGAIQVRSSTTGERVTFLSTEWAVFIQGARDGQYDAVVLGGRVHPVDTLHTAGEAL